MIDALTSLDSLKYIPSSSGEQENKKTEQRSIDKSCGAIDFMLWGFWG